MKIGVYSCRDDEQMFFHQFGKNLGIELVLHSEAPSMDNADLLEGCQAVSIITTNTAAPLIDLWHSYGVKVISTRTVGFEHIDYQHAAKLGITVSNVSYTPHTVAEYTVMIMLMCIRKMKAIMVRYSAQDYRLNEIRGREIRNLVIGVIGTGKIGEMVIRNLSGFGCKILAYDLYQKESVKEFAEYVLLEEIWKKSDLITLHAPASEETYRLIRKETLAQMKDGVILINMARGSLLDTGAVIEALESGKLGAAALDVLEGESKIYYRDFKYQPVKHHEMAILNAMPNVLLTPHTAFFTDEAVRDMVGFSLQSCVQTLQGEKNTWKVN